MWAPAARHRRRESLPPPGLAPGSAAGLPCADPYCLRYPCGCRSHASVPVPRTCPLHHLTPPITAPPAGGEKGCEHKPRPTLDPP